MKGDLVVIGCSLGGLAALETILQGLPKRFSAPIAIVQHRMPDSRSRLAAFLQLYTSLRVKEPQDKEAIESSTVYVAPADYHLLIEEEQFALSTDEPILSARPSINALFESAADSLSERVIAVVLSGASADGAVGARRIKEQGGRLIVQAPESAESAIMPRAAILHAIPDEILPLAQIATTLGLMTATQSEEDEHPDP